MILDAFKSISADPKKRYIWTIGVLGWGGSMFLTMTTLEFLFPSRPSPRSSLNIAITILSGLALWLTGGWVFGRTMWEKYQKKLKRNKYDQTSN